MFVDDPVGVGGDALLGRRVEVVSAGVVFVGWPELYRMFLESPQYGSSGHEPGQLVSLQHADSVLDISDDFLPGLLQAEVKVSTPEAAVVAVKYFVAFLQRQSFGKIEHRGDLLEVLDSVLDIVLVGS